MVLAVGPVMALGTSGVSIPGISNPPEARLYDLSGLSSADIADPATASDQQLWNESVAAEPLLTVSADGTGNADLTAVYGEEFARRFSGGLNVAQADLDGDGYPELITAPGPLVDPESDPFGASLRTIGIFNGNPNASARRWNTAALDLSGTYGGSYSGGFLVTVGAVNAAGDPRIVVAPLSPAAVFNGVAIYDVRPSSGGGQPAARGEPLETPGLNGKITGIAVGEFEGRAEDGGPVHLVVATNQNSLTTVTAFLIEPASLSSASQLLASLPLEDCAGHVTDVFANGASLAAGDLNGDWLDELVLGAGPQGMGVFRVATGRAVTMGNQLQFDNAMRTNWGPFSSIMAGGRFKDFGVSPGEHPAEQASNLDLFYGTTSPAARSFISPLTVQVVETETYSGIDFSGEPYTSTWGTLFVTIGGFNAADSAVRRFSFEDNVNPARRWYVRQGFKPLPAEPADLRRTPAVDLNGDGIADGLWRDAVSGGVVGLLYGETGEIVGTRVLGGNADWTIGTPGDFDGDKVTDFIWLQASSGLAVLRLLNPDGSTKLAELTGSSTEWGLEASGDYDGDGVTDVVWRHHASGSNVMWLMDGVNVPRQTPIGGNPDWRLVSTGPDFDVNADGRNDLIWRHAPTGVNIVKRMNGSRELSATVLPGGGSDWEIVATGDYDGDGYSDVLWRQSSTGTTVQWLLVNAAVQRSTWLGGSLDWSVVASDDADGDGRSDFAWRQSSTGITVRRLAGCRSTYLGGDRAWSLVRRPGRQVG